MLDALKVDGPSTASMLAKRTGQAVGNASHHLKVLAGAGLVEEAPELAKDKRERWWRLVSAGTRWTTSEFGDDAAALALAREAEVLQLRRQVERVQQWMANADSDPVWDDAAFATQNRLTLSPQEMYAVAEEIMAVLKRWSEREIPEEGAERGPASSSRAASPHSHDPGHRTGCPAPRRQPERPPALVRRGRLGSRLTTTMVFPLLAVLVFDVGLGPLGLLPAATWLPWLLFSLPAGVWIDRGDPRRIMIAADLASAAVTASVPIAWALGRLTLVHVVLAALGVGAGAVFFRTADSSFVPRVVAKDDLESANSRLFGTESAMQIAGPGVGGALVALVGVAYAVVLDTLSFLVSALCLVRMGPTSWPGPSPLCANRWPRPSVPGCGSSRAIRMCASPRSKAASRISP